MKTAMQELIEWLKQYEGQMISADQAILKAYKLFNKEDKTFKQKSKWIKHYKQDGTELKFSKINNL